MFTNGIEVDKGKVNFISKLPLPKTVKKTRSFLGHVGYYKRLSAIYRPFCNILMKDMPFEWTKECQKAFEKTISLLTLAPIM